MCEVSSNNIQESKVRSKGWIGIDLDGTLATHHDWNGGLIGAPIPKMVRRVKQWLAEGKDVRIMTARVSECGGYSEESGGMANRIFVMNQRELISKWCLQHIGRMLPITCEKDFQMVELWDDRAVQVRKNTGITVEEELQESEGRLRYIRRLHGIPPYGSGGGPY